MLIPNNRILSFITMDTLWHNAKRFCNRSSLCKILLCASYLLNERANCNPYFATIEGSACSYACSTVSGNSCNIRMTGLALSPKSVNGFASIPDGLFDRWTEFLHLYIGYSGLFLLQSSTYHLRKIQYHLNDYFLNR